MSTKALIERGSRIRISTILWERDVETIEDLMREVDRLRELQKINPELDLDWKIHALLLIILNEVDKRR